MERRKTRKRKAQPTIFKGAEIMVLAALRCLKPTKHSRELKRSFEAFLKHVD